MPAAAANPRRLECADVPLRVTDAAVVAALAPCASCAATIRVGGPDADEVPSVAAARGAPRSVGLAMSSLTTLAFPSGRELRAVDAALYVPGAHRVPGMLGPDGSGADLVFYFAEGGGSGSGSGAVPAVAVVLPVQAAADDATSGRGVAFFRDLGFAAADAAAGRPQRVVGRKARETLAALLGGGGALAAIEYTAPPLGAPATVCAEPNRVRYLLLTQPVRARGADLAALRSLLGAGAAALPGGVPVDALRFRRWASAATVTVGTAAASASASTSAKPYLALTRAMQCRRIDPDADVAGGQVRLRPGGGGRTLAEELATSTAAAAAAQGGAPAAPAAPQGGVKAADVEAIVGIVVGTLAGAALCGAAYYYVRKAVHGARLDAVASLYGG